MKKLISTVFAVSVLAAGSAASAQVVYSSGLGAGASADFTIVSTADTLVTFGSDWSARAIDATAGQPGNVVPASPGGDSVGLAIEVNNTDDATDYEEAVAIYYTAPVAAANFDVEFDAFIAYTVPIVGGGSGSTEELGITVKASGSKINTIHDDALDNVNPALPGSVADLDANAGQDYVDIDGLNFGYTGDDGYAAASANIYCFDPLTRVSANGSAANEVLDGQVVTGWTGPVPNTTDGLDGFNSSPYFESLTFPAGRTVGITGGGALGNATPGYVWNKIKAAVRGSSVTFSVNGVDFVTTTTAAAGNKVGIVAGDYFNSVSLPVAESFVLVDNFKITAISSSDNWNTYE